MSSPSDPPKPRAWIGQVALAAIVLAMFGAVAALWQIDPWGEQGNRLSERFDYDLETYTKVDPAIILYRQTAEFAVPLEEPRAIAIGPGDSAYVAGDQAIVSFGRDGMKASQIELEEPPRCLAVARSGAPGLIYVGMKGHVEVYDAQGSRQASWPRLGDKAQLTSIALGESDVFAADAGSRIVWRYDPDGKLLGQIGKRDEDRHIPGFVVPSPYFDLAITPDGLVRVANPGRHSIEGYTPEGHLEVVWGKPSLGIEGFCGCCNTANFALLADGSFVTAEKGIPRIKVYDPEGKFEGVVASPEVLAPTATIAEETRTDHKLAVFDVATDSQGRVLVLDPSGRRVRVFERLDRSGETKAETKHE
jgi:hypothetical protein